MKKVRLNIVIEFSSFSLPSKTPAAFAGPTLLLPSNPASRTFFLPKSPK